METNPQNLYEAASYELNKFRERRLAERRATQRDTPDRRVGGDARRDQAFGNPPGKLDDPA